MSAYGIAKTIITRICREHMSEKATWVAEMELADTERWIAEQLEPALEEQFELGWRERGFHKEEEI